MRLNPYARGWVDGFCRQPWQQMSGRWGSARWLDRTEQYDIGRRHGSQYRRFWPGIALALVACAMIVAYTIHSDNMVASVRCTHQTVSVDNKQELVCEKGEVK